MTYYYSESGNNNNPGTKKNPFKTLDYAKCAAKEGDSIIKILEKRNE
jgi:hypothetical protein